MDSDDDSEMETYHESDYELSQFADKLKFDCQILTPDKVLKSMNDTIAKINTIIQLSVATVRILLNHFKWNKECLMDCLYGNQQEEIFKELNIPNPFTTVSQVAKKKKLDDKEPSECEVCCEFFPGSELIGLECDHIFCRNCWNGHLNSKILDQGTDKISCLQYKCDTLMDQEKCLEILQDEKTRQIYTRLITNSFVECNRFLLWCPNPKCDLVIQVDYIQATVPVICRCKFSFCCNCLKDWHSPLSCSLLQKWLAKFEVDSQTETWLIAKSKQCPKCKIRIEKNGGCNHMTCMNTNCGHEFCWICEVTWKNSMYRNHGCLDADDSDTESEENTDDQTQDPQKSLDVYFSHYELYATHKQSLELEEKLVAKITDKVDQLINSGVRETDATVLEEGVVSLKRCRKTLMYTYPFAYFLDEESNQTAIFKNNQADLQSATERLSAYLEREMDQVCFTTFRLKLLELCRYCEKRCYVLENHVKEGYKGFDGIESTQWEFTQEALN